MWRQTCYHFMIENHALTFRIASVMTAVSLLTFGTLVETCKLLF